MVRMTLFQIVKKMINELLLLSGNDIPIEEINLLLHPPTIKEIAYIGEDKFFSGCEFLRFTKDKLSSEDRNRLENISNFEIIMSIMREKNPSVQINKTCAQMVLSLLFPTYQIQIDIENLKIIFTQEKDNLTFELNKNNYDKFIEALNEILCLGGGSSDYKPSGSLARQIADKLRDRQAKLAAAKGMDNQKIAILSRYVSILAVGENKDMNSLLNYTTYQLFDEFKRYQLKIAWDIHIKAQLAGAKDLQEVDDWMEDIHSNVDENGVLKNSNNK